VKHKTEQEQFWAGKFGDDYILRNKGDQILSSNVSLFRDIIDNTKGVKSAIEFGANIGLNLEAIKQLREDIELSAIEINKKAVSGLSKLKNIKIYPQSILEFSPDYPRNLVFTKGVLIHVNPDFLPRVYDLLYKTSNRYICIIEYYNKTPVEVMYRGHKGKLFKRDFAGEILDRYEDLMLTNYGFVYHRDNNFPQDDLSWFLLEKKGNP
jgi:spore coat polysaccharide biosynthesis protein SpsF